MDADDQTDRPGGPGARSTMARRTLLKSAAASVAAPALSLGSHQVFAQSTRKYSTRTVDLMRRAIVIDMLSPVVVAGDPVPIFSKPISDTLKADYRRSGLTAISNSVGFLGPNQKVQVLQYMLAWSGFAARNSDVFQLVGQAADIDKAKREGKVAMIMGIQNADHFETPDDVREFYQFGQRIGQLTYNAQNLLGAGSTERVDGGLSDFGAAIVAAMNDVGMLVDVSHCGDRTTLDAIAASSKAIAITHGNVRAINNHPRCKTDEAIRACAAKGGVMGITNLRMFVRDRDPTTIDHVVDHIAYVAKLVGVEHVGIGSDQHLYGYDNLPPEIVKAMQASFKSSYGFREKLDSDDTSHPQRNFDLTEALIRRGFSDQDILGILGGNFRRLLGATWL